MPSKDCELPVRFGEMNVPNNNLAKMAEKAVIITCIQKVILKHLA